MKILFLGGVFASENQKEVIRHAKSAVEYSANRFQEKLINGFYESGYDISVLSAPFIGAYPVGSDVIFFKGFEDDQDKYEYVNFCNIWGVRNFSRAKSLKQALKSFIAEDDSEKTIIVYSSHTPFLEAATYAKKRDPKIKINLVVPDLPQYTNLNSTISLMYKIGKYFDIKKFNKLLRNVDSFVLLTEHMKDMLNVKERPYIIVEGIIERETLEKGKTTALAEKTADDVRYIVYTGKLNEKFGVKKLVDSFSFVSNPNYRLVLCGRGDLDEYIGLRGKEDPRIMSLGQVTPEVACSWVSRADVLVNPRPNNEEYTKYSFPSKNIEYLSSGRPVVAFMLDGMQEMYKNFIIEINDFDEKNIVDTIVSAVENSKFSSKSLCFIEYAKENLCADIVARRIIEMCKD